MSLGAWSTVRGADTAAAAGTTPSPLGPPMMADSPAPDHLLDEDVVCAPFSSYSSFCFILCVCIWLLPCSVVCRRAPSLMRVVLCVRDARFYRLR